MCLVLAGAVTTARASSLIVPDDAASIQAALDARVDTVFVRGGGKPESPVVRVPVTLLAMPRDHGLARPVLAGLTVQTSNVSTVPLHIGGLHFTGLVNVINGNGPIYYIDLVDCQLESGISDACDCDNGSTRRLTLRRCKLSGVSLLDQRGENDLDSCVVNGRLVVAQPDTRLAVTDSEFHGSGTGVGIDGFSNGEGINTTLVRGSSFEGYSTAMMIQPDITLDVSGNVIHDCNDSGILIPFGTDGTVRLSGNRVERCGGNGISVGSSESAVLEANTVSHSGGTGIVAAVENATVRGNVVWNSGGDGFVIDADGWDVSNNTSSANAGSGFVLTCELPGSSECARNIGFANGRYGVRWVTPEAPSMGCNDWFGNALGAVQGLPASSDDFAVDPIFCDAANGDFRLAARSPLAEPAGCGLVGALGVGCADVNGASVSSGVPNGPKFRLDLTGPSPGRVPVQIEFELAHQAAIALDVFDVQGRLVASPAQGVWPGGRHAAVWPTDGARMAGGIYLVRYRYPGGEIRRRLIRIP